MKIKATAESKLTDNRDVEMVTGEFNRGNPMVVRASHLANQAGIKRLGAFLLPPWNDEMLVHRRVTPSIKFTGIHLYTWVERGNVRGKCCTPALITLN